MDLLIPPHRATVAVPSVRLDTAPGRCSVTLQPFPLLLS